MNAKRDDEDFEARFEREIAFSNAQPYPRAKRARLQSTPLPPDRHAVSDDGVDAGVVKRKRSRLGAKPRLVPIQDRPSFTPGQLAGRVRVSDDFDDPLPDEILDDFEGRG